MERDETVVIPEPQPGQPTPGKRDAAAGHPEVISITDAAAAHSEDMRERMIKYALAMGIRMVCLIMIFVVDGWLKLVAVAGAVFLPWIAVVIANGSDKAEIHSDALLDYTPYAELGAADDDSGTAESADTADEPTVLQGELIADDEDDDDGRGQKAS
jgi:hypothetical protein